jgi:hypothetical protein
MNDNYLWDRTGEPDPQIQRLEELLGTLRYLPRPLVIPEPPPAAHRRMFFPALAIAATVALVVLVAGLWFALNRNGATQPGEAKTRPVEQKSNDKPAPEAMNPTGAKENAPPLRKDTLANSPHLRHRNMLASGPHRQSKTAFPPSEMSANEVAVAKDQLLLALRVASAKLQLAQRRTQTTPAPNTIRNQHRIG